MRAPAFANSSVGSPTGTTGDELTSVWSCFSSKYDVNVCRTFAAGHSSDAHDALVEASDMCVVRKNRRAEPAGARSRCKPSRLGRKATAHAAIARMERTLMPSHTSLRVSDLPAHPSIKSKPRESERTSF